MNDYSDQDAQPDEKKQKGGVAKKIKPDDQRKAQNDWSTPKPDRTAGQPGDADQFDN